MTTYNDNSVVNEVKITDFEISEELNKDSYYVQIATCSKPESVEAIISEYGDRYPIVCMNNGKDQVQVLIGELNQDEYGIVLNRFKAYGFKDAFLKVVK